MKKLIILILFFSVILAQAQKHPEHKRANNWCFGKNAGLCFNSGQPVSFTSGMWFGGYEAVSTISDTAGNLLMYTNGMYVWNRNHDVMQNGTGLAGCQSSWNGSLILPQPGNDSLYFIFTSDCSENNYLQGFRYSVVNLNGDNGLGSVIVKNVILADSTLESITATYHSNLRDFWVLTSNINDSLMIFRFDSSGITLSGAYESNYKMLDIIGKKSNINRLKFSPKGDILSFSSSINQHIDTCDIVRLLRFDKRLGVVTEEQFIKKNEELPYLYHLSFTNSGKNLILLFSGSEFATNTWLYRYNVENTIDSLYVVNSEELIVYSNYIKSISIQTSPLGNMLISACQTGLPALGADYLHLFAFPDTGTISSFIISGVDLSPNKTYSIMNNTAEDWLYNPDTTIGIEYEKEYENILLFPLPCSDYCIINGLKDGSFVRVIDIYGKQINAYKVNGNTFTLDTKELSNGVYLVEITDENSFKTTKKIIVQQKL